MYYALDVAFPNLKLDVEADGHSHKTKLGKIRDAKRTKWITEHGWKIVRFSNARIVSDTKAVRSELMSTISTLENTIHT